MYMYMYMCMYMYMYLSIHSNVGMRKHSFIRDTFLSALDCQPCQTGTLCNGCA